ncbi:hypothetical protein GALMADRAFT_74168 [Galerina marginata CBS 339.88]|uniref:Protein kinase domain-containing protein n=1 Tax=Galerina marginata (strain CBS 339.88) TaxID=685588 RepID=A0A067SX22_GALM3|nr:hypothetical protein GALMADRAFT_74168 [Galerina marginata CBS 339.88]
MIRPDNSQLGKATPGGLQIWGETLFDFYSVNRLPGLFGQITHSSGSKLAAWMKKFGEADFVKARNFMLRAEEEDEPRLIEPCDIARLIKDEEHIWPMQTGKRSWVRKVGKGKGMEREFWQLPEPVIARQLDLQIYLQQSTLPPRLIVHDPWKILNVSEYCHIEDQETVSWNQKEDIQYVYKLKTSERYTSRKDKDDKELKEDEARRKKELETFLADPHSRNRLPSGYMIPVGDEKPGPAKPPIFVVLPFLHNRKTPKEAHLYIHPAGKIGEGNHSVVYNVEWELPRNYLVDEEICHRCVMEDVQKTLEEEDGPNGKHRHPKWDTLSGGYVPETKTKAPVVLPMKIGGEDATMQRYLFSDGDYSVDLKYEGPYRVVKSRVGYQDLSKAPYCEHLRALHSSIHPLTAKVHVAAKLSLEGDDHLAREAENYQAFPRHFFEHWSGFNVVPPIWDPVPVGPIVPQYYGYYVPEDKVSKYDVKAMEKSEEDMDVDEQQPQPLRKIKQPYLSPILLLENCGSPIQPEELSVDDISECGSLVHRFAEEEWVHGSIAKRNILKQPGPLSAWPIQRTMNAMRREGLGEQWSFRLIDFGRSFNPKTRNVQEREVINLLRNERATATGWVQEWKTLN